MVDHVGELLTEVSALRRAGHNEPLRGEGAWDHGLDVDGFLRRIIAELDRLPLVVVEHAEFDHYGSGYASYVDVFATKRDGSTRCDEGAGQISVECLNVLLCRLAPVACLLRPDIRGQGPGGTGSWAMPHVDRVITAPNQSWTREYHQIRNVLNRHSVTLIGTDLLTRPLSEGLAVDTNFADSAQTIFDAWFHWRD